MSIISMATITLHDELEHRSVWGAIRSGTRYQNDWQKGFGDSL